MGGHGSCDAGLCRLGWCGLEPLVKGLLLHPAQALLLMGLPKKMKQRRRKRHVSNGKHMQNVLLPLQSGRALCI